MNWNAATTIVMTHPARSAIPDSPPIHLARVLQAGVVHDPDPDGPPQAYRCARAAWTAAHAHATKAQTPWAIVTEDDALPGQQAHAAIRRVLSDAPPSLVSFYLGHRHPSHRTAKQDNRLGLNITRLRPGFFVPTVCLAIPTRWIPDLLDWSADIADLYDNRMDEVIGAWADVRGHDAYATLPSLVNHRTDQPSMIEPDAPKRYALYPPRGDLSQIDWAFPASAAA